MAERRLSGDERGATMLESAIAIPILLAFLLFTVGFSVNVYEYLRMSHALRVTGRLASMQTVSSMSGLSGCAATVSRIFDHQLGAGRYSSAHTIQTTIHQSGTLRGLLVELNAPFDLYLIPNQLIPLQFRAESFIPLEDQNACQ